MAVNVNGGWIGFGVGDSDPDAPRNAPNWHAVSLLNEKLYDRFQATHPLGQQRIKTIYDEVTAKSVELIAGNYGMTVPRDLQGNAVANLAFRTKIGAYPPPKPPTHALFTVRGTGGVIGQDYTSWIPGALPGIYHEHPIDYAATMGGIPVAVAGAGPSGNECAEQVHQMLTDAVMGSTVSFSIAGYSLATKGIHMFLNDLCNPNHPLNAHLHRLVAVVLIGDPWRPFGHSFYLGPIPSGQGIGTPYFTLSDQAIKTLGWRICWLTNPADMYANSPLGGTGLVLADVEEIILGLSMSDPMGTMMLALREMMKIITQDAGLMEMLPGGSLLTGGGLAGILTGIAGGSTLMSVGLAGFILPLFMGGFQGLISGISGNGANLPKGPAADVQAAILALKFYGSGIHGHISYHDTPWGIGPQTYMELGIQHAADWGSRTPVLT